MSSEASWNPGVPQFQQFFTEQWAKALAAFPAASPDTCPTAALKFDAAKLQELQQAYVQEASQLWSQGLAATANLQDKRFGTTALAVLAARGESPVASATLLTTLVDFTDTGILDVFIDETFVQMRELQMGQGGLLKGQELASTFSFLRPNDLVWNYVVGNYLKGETPPPFDLLYWNSDATNLPGPWYNWYLRNMYLENNLVKPGKLTVCGQSLDLGAIDIPVYIYGSREDHIVPITGSYATTQVLPGAKRFVMGASGHIAGVINPPAKKKRSHWIRQDGVLPATHAQWLERAQELPGSWWTDWSQWLQSHAGKPVAAPKRYGRGTKYQALEAAPGSYVQQKA